MGDKRWSWGVLRERERFRHRLAMGRGRFHGRCFSLQDLMRRVLLTMLSGVWRSMHYWRGWGWGDCSFEHITNTETDS